MGLNLFKRDVSRCRKVVFITKVLYECTKVLYEGTKVLFWEERFSS